MLKWLICIVLVMVACDPIEPSVPPEFSSFSVTALGSNQIEVRWLSGLGSIQDHEELRFGLWVVESGQTIDTAADPDILTEEGAISYNIIDGLDGIEIKAATGYEVLVRARNRGMAFSENDSSRSVTSLAVGQGRFKEESIIDLRNLASPLKMTAGVVFDGARDDIGVISGLRLNWYRSDASGNLMTEGNTSVNETIEEALLIRTRFSRNFDDLLVLTAANLYFYENDGTGFDASTTPFDELPQPGSLSFLAKNGERETLVSFVGPDGTALMYTYNEDDGFTPAGTYQLNDSSALFRLVDLDGNDFYDMVIFAGNQLLVALDSGENLRFGNAATIETFTDQTIVPTQTRVSLFALDGDGDNEVDIFLLPRDATEDSTLLWFYAGLGNGEFSSKTETDYLSAFYETPSFQEANGNGATDLVLPQDVSNNVAVVAGPSSRFDFVETFYGGSGRISQAFFRDFDGRNNNDRDLALLSSQDKKLTILLSNDP